MKPEYDVAMDVAAAEKILLDDYIFAPVPIVPTRHLVKPGVHGWAASAARYDNTQFLTLDQWRVAGASPRAPGIFMDR